MNFSVLISLYYKENPSYLKESLESLKNQTLQANEIVIIFDGKITDNLENIVNHYKPLLPIKIIQLPKNVGLGNALNEGLKYCSNEWIFRMDTDDICFPERFEKQVKYIEHNPDVVLFSSSIAEFEESIENIKSYRKVAVKYDDIRKKALLNNPFNHMTVVFRKSIIEKVGGYQHHLFFEDWNLWLRVISENYKVGNVEEVLLYARTGDSMIERRKGVDYIKSEWKLFQLKQKLNMENFFSGFTIFIVRSLPRLLPTSILKEVYKLARKR